MATGDPPMYMVPPNYLPCGCYTGVWHGIQSPPRCEQHSTGRDLSGGDRASWPWGRPNPRTPFATPRLPGRPLGGRITEICDEADDFALINTFRDMITADKKNTRVDVLDLYSLLEQLGEEIGKHVGREALRGDEGTAAHDSWQLAIQALVNLRACISRAREVTRSAVAVSVTQQAQENVDVGRPKED